VGDEPRGDGAAECNPGADERDQQQRIDDESRKHRRARCDQTSPRPGAKPCATTATTGTAASAASTTASVTRTEALRDGARIGRL
jgi:hypothetical protein